MIGQRYIETGFFLLSVIYLDVLIRKVAAPKSNGCDKPGPEHEERCGKGNGIRLTTIGIERRLAEIKIAAQPSYADDYRSCRVQADQSSYRPAAFIVSVLFDFDLSVCNQPGQVDPSPLLSVARRVVIEANRKVVVGDEVVPHIEAVIGYVVFVAVIFIGIRGMVTIAKIDWTFRNKLVNPKTGLSRINRK